MRASALINTVDWFASNDAESQLFEPLSVDECEGDAGGVCVAMESCQSPPDEPRQAARRAAPDQFQSHR